MAQRVQLRRGTAASAAADNPVLAQGEEGHETDTGKRKVGDGSTAWNDLGYWPTPADVGALAPNGNGSALTGITAAQVGAATPAAVATAQANAIAASLPTLAQASVSASGALALDTITNVTAATALTMTLPTAITGALIVVERASASTANVAVTGNIRGVAAQTVTLLLSNESEAFFATGGSWWPIAGHKTLSSLDARYDASGAAAAETTRAETAEALLAPLTSLPSSGSPLPLSVGGTGVSAASGTALLSALGARPLIAQMTVTATQGGATFANMSMALRVLTGASGAAGITGANATFGSPQQVAVTPQASGSVIYGALFGFSATPTTPNAATQFLQQQTGPANYAQFRSAGLTTAATPVTVGLSSANTGIGICAAEIKAAAGQTLAEDPSSPPTTPFAAVTAQTTAAFAPPPGSVLVLLVTAPGSKSSGSGVTTMSVTDTSGLGLTWTEVVKQNNAVTGYVGVWTAQVPTTSTAAYPVIPEVDDRMAAILRNFQAASKGVVALMSAIANRDTAPCNVAVIGDSITEGMGATAFASRYVAQAGKALRQRYPTLANGSSGGLGLIPWASSGETTYTWPIVNTSGQGPGTASDIGPARRAYVFNGASTWTFTAPAGSTSVKVMYYNDNTGSQFSYQVNSGAVTTVTASGTVQDGTLTSSITMTGGDVLTVRWVSGTVYLEGIVHWAADESSGITLHGCGHFGISTAGWIAAQAGGIDWRTSIAALAPVAIAVNLGTNDNSGSITGPATQANLQALITYLRGNATLANVPFLVMIPQACTASAQLWIRALPANAGQVQLIDLAYRTPSQAQAGYLYSDSVHPSNAGHAFLGQILAAAIGIV